MSTCQPESDAVDALIAVCRAQLTKVTECGSIDNLFDLAALAGNGLPTLLDEIDRLRGLVVQLEAAQPKPELLGYLPSITRVGRCLEPGEHISPTETPIPDGVAVWMNGAPPEAGPTVAHAAAVDGGCGWFVDTVELDGSRSDADGRCHSWMSDAGYRAVVVELRAVAG